MRRIERRLGNQEPIAALKIRTRGDLVRSQPEKLITGDLRRNGPCLIPHRERGPRFLVENGIVAYQKICARVKVSFLSISDDYEVVRLRTLLDYVVLDERIAAIR